MNHSFFRITSIFVAVLVLFSSPQGWAQNITGLKESGTFDYVRLDLGYSNVQNITTNDPICGCGSIDPPLIDAISLPRKVPFVRLLMNGKECSSVGNRNTPTSINDWLAVNGLESGNFKSLEIGPASSETFALDRYIGALEFNCNGIENCEFRLVRINDCLESLGLEKIGLDDINANLVSNLKIFKTCYRNRVHPIVNFETVAIKAPVDVEASDDRLQGIKLTWRSTTDIPLERYGFNVYRDGELLTTVDAPTEDSELWSYIDPVTMGSVHQYAISTYSDNSEWGFPESELVAAPDSGRTYHLDFAASDGEIGGSQLSWNSLGPAADNAEIEEIIIKRDGELVTSIAPSRTSTRLRRTYLDDCGVPGQLYQYTLELHFNNGKQPLVGQVQLADMGHRLPVGVIAGTVQGLGPNSNMEICATSVTGLTNEYYSGPYCTEVDPVTGNYRIDGIFFGAADSLIVAPKQNAFQLIVPAERREFLNFLSCDNPDNRQQLLDVDFTREEAIDLEFVFTPNDDGFNDFFVIPELEDDPESYSNNQLTIVSRWGEVVYQGNNYNNDWDGRHWKSNEPLPAGTYVYIMRLDVGKAEVRKSTVTIVR